TRHSSFHAPSLNIIHPSLPSFPTRRSSDLDGDELREGLVLIAPGDYHMVITPAKRVRLNQDPPVHYVRPSVDVMMLSVAAVFGRSEEHTSELQSRENLVCRLLLAVKK